MYNHILFVAVAVFVPPIQFCSVQFGDDYEIFRSNGGGGI